MKHVCSLSGGRTSTGVLPNELIKKYGKDNIDFVFCDTGAEKDGTYQFVRDFELSFNVKVTCLKLVMPKEKGKGARYLVCDSSEIKNDYFAWKQLTSKYGNPFIPGGKFCTDQMKARIFKKYCDDSYGEGNYYTWIGYRYEEGNRIWGKDASIALGKLGMDNTEKTDFYLECLSGGVDSLLEQYFPSMFPCESDEKEKQKIKKSLSILNGKGFRFLPELSKLNKADVIQWFDSADFNLKVEEHETNCIFCPEKPVGTIMLAIKDSPEEAKEFLSVVESEEVAHKPNRKHHDHVMYRGNLTFRGIYEKTQKLKREDVLKMSRIGNKIAKEMSCSNSECSPFGDIHEEQADMFS